MKNLVECIESYEGVGAVQGIILDLDSKTIDTAGGIVTEILYSYPAYHRRSPASIKKRDFYIAYADGAFSLYSIEAVKKATGYIDKIFEDEMFAYFDDKVLGLQLWDRGFRVVSCSFIAALHRRSSTFGKINLKRLYLMTRSYFALNELCNSRYKSILRKTYLRKIITNSISLTARSRLLGSRQRLQYSLLEISKITRQGYIDGTKWGQRKLLERGSPIDLYKAPIVIDSPLSNIPRLILGIGTDFLKSQYNEYITSMLERGKYRVIRTSYRD